jgi:hypothetical protein
MNDEYWTDPKKGFDKGWHDRLEQKKQGKERRLKREIDLGEHSTHNWQPVKLESGPHAGKLICITCNNKFIRWLPKDAF